jgi:hypothetical protein
MTTSVASPQPAARSRLGKRLASFTPLAILAVASIVSPTFFPPIIAKPPDWLTFPLGVVMEAIAMLWMSLGVALAWNARSRSTEALALMLFTIPATLVAVFTPAIVLILQILA